MPFYSMRARRAACPLAMLLAIVSAGPPARAAEPGPPRRGGVLRLLARSAPGSIDPQVNATGQFWQLCAFAYDGLLATRKTNGAAGLEVVPDLADSMPAVEMGGRRYRFRLREGIRFSDGSPVRPGDVAASFRRMFKVAGPGAGSFFGGIVGADACLRRPADCMLPGVAADPVSRSVTIDLVAPDPEFPLKLTLPPASILPASAPARDAGTTPLPGTGAYRIAAYDPNEAIRFERNPFFRPWSEAAQPDGYPDRVEEAFGLEPESALTEVENGQADWMYDPPPADRLAELGTRHAALVHLNPALAIWYLAPNSRLPPFDDPRVRQALDLAIDRAALVRLAGGQHLARPACRMLPPGIPGHEPGLSCPPDMARARRLVAASGTAGQRVALVTGAGPMPRAIGLYVQSVLRDLGYAASLRPLSGDIAFTYIQNSDNKVQLALTDWYADYPAPSDFLRVLFACDQFHPGSDSSLNIGGFCDPAIDRAMAGALAEPDPDRAAGLWRGVDRALADRAAAVPLFVPTTIDVTSDRVGGFVYNSQYHWLATRSWVK